MKQLLIEIKKAWGAIQAIQRIQTFTNVEVLVALKHIKAFIIASVKNITSGCYI